MNWLDVGKKIVEYGFPILGGAVGGPGGAVAAKLLTQALGINHDPQVALDAIVSHPDPKNFLRGVEQTYPELKRISVELDFNDNKKEVE